MIYCGIEGHILRKGRIVDGRMMTGDDTTRDALERVEEQCEKSLRLSILSDLLEEPFSNLCALEGRHPQLVVGGVKVEWIAGIEDVSKNVKGGERLDVPAAPSRGLHLGPQSVEVFLTAGLRPDDVHVGHHARLEHGHEVEVLVVGSREDHLEGNTACHQTGKELGEGGARGGGGEGKQLDCLGYVGILKEGEVDNSLECGILVVCAQGHVVVGAR